MSCSEELSCFENPTSEERLSCFIGKDFLFNHVSMLGDRSLQCDNGTLYVDSVDSTTAAPMLIGPQGFSVILLSTFLLSMFVFLVSLAAIIRDRKAKAVRNASLPQEDVETPVLAAPNPRYKSGLQKNSKKISSGSKSGAGSRQLLAETDAPVELSALGSHLKDLFNQPSFNEILPPNSKFFIVSRSNSKSEFIELNSAFTEQEDKVEEERGGREGPQANQGVGIGKSYDSFGTGSTSFQDSRNSSASF